MRHHRSRLALASLSVVLAGCGGKSPVVPPLTPVIPATPSVLSALPGDWLAFGVPPSPGTAPILATPIASFSGAIALSGATITGVFHALAPDLASGCPSIATTIPFTGTLDAANNLTLTGALSGGVATIRAALPQNLNTYITGKYEVVGGTCPMSSTPMKIAQFASTTGTYTGTYNAMDLTTNTVLPGTATVITATLMQSPIPDADGQFPFTGTVVATGACAGKLTIANGTVLGGSVHAPYSSLITPPTGEFSGALNPAATNLIGGFSLFSACANPLYLGTLTRQ